jgi:hypothetical protein
VGCTCSNKLQWRKGALQVPFDLADGQDRELVFVLGAGDDRRARGSVGAAAIACLTLMAAAGLAFSWYAEPLAGWFVGGAAAQPAVAGLAARADAMMLRIARSVACGTLYSFVHAFQVAAPSRRAAICASAADEMWASTL